MVYEITYTEKSVYREEIEADSEEQAAQIWEQMVESGEVDFSRMDIVDSNVRCELVEGEVPVWYT